jgi:hypothetical protein
MDPPSLPCGMAMELRPPRPRAVITAEPETEITAHIDEKSRLA